MGETKPHTTDIEDEDSAEGSGKLGDWILSIIQKAV